MLWLHPWGAHKPHRVPLFLLYAVLRMSPVASHLPTLSSSPHFVPFIQTYQQHLNATPYLQQARWRRLDFNILNFVSLKKVVIHNDFFFYHSEPESRSTIQFTQIGDLIAHIRPRPHYLTSPCSSRSPDPPFL